MSVTYSYTVTDEEDAAITARRLRVAPLVADNNTFVANDIRDNVLGPIVKAYIETRVQIIADKYRRATTAERDAADAALVKVVFVVTPAAPPPAPTTIP